MAHTVIKAERWAAAALGLLEREIVLAGLVGRNAGADFVGAKNDTVNIKRPGMLAGTVEALRAMQGASYQIVTEELAERSISVSLDHHIYSAVDLTDAELSLDIGDFGAQVLSPQVRAIANRVEFLVAQKLNNLTPALTVTAEDPADGSIRRAIIELRKALNKSDVPQTGRILVIGVDVEAFLLQDPNLSRAADAGDSSALRAAEVGRLYGFRVVVSNTIESNRMVAFHPSAYTLVTRAPRVPEGAVSGRSESYAGVAMRAIRDYNSATARDRSFLSTFAGIGETLDPEVTWSEDGVPTLGDDAMLRAVAATVTVTEPEPDPGE